MRRGEREEVRSWLCFTASGDVRCGIFGFYMGALRWDGRDARFRIENRFRILAHFCRFRHNERNMVATRLDRRRAVETCAEQVLRAPPAFQARIGHRTRIAESKPVPASSRTFTDSYQYAGRTIGIKKPSGPNPIVHSDGCLFHVKQCLFLPRFHVKQSSFSVRQTAARPSPPPACHSERQRRIFALDLQTVL